MRSFGSFLSICFTQSFASFDTEHQSTGSNSTSAYRIDMKISLFDSPSKGGYPQSST